jgi:hypothetical protein
VTLTVTRTENRNYKLALLRIDDLRPHEKGSPVYLELLKREIIEDGVVKYPIIAEENTHVILDGMHRWLTLKSLGYTLAPVMLVNVFQKPRIHVGRRRIHRYTGDPDGQVTVEKVLSAGLKGQLMEARSTRHFFPFSKYKRIDCPLQVLERRCPQDVSEYLSQMTPKECKKAIEEWLEEMMEELSFLEKRKEEVEREKEDFLNRVKMLEDKLPIC